MMEEIFPYVLQTSAYPPSTLRNGGREDLTPSTRHPRIKLTEKHMETGTCQDMGPLRKALHLPTLHPHLLQPSPEASTKNVLQQHLVSKFPVPFLTLLLPLQFLMYVVKTPSYLGLSY